jgi:hypothetical protein
MRMVNQIDHICVGKVIGTNGAFFMQKDRDWIESEKPGYTPYAYPHPLRG